MPALAIVVGNPKPRSRTRDIAESLGERVAHAVSARTLPTIDLADHAAELFSWPAERVDRALEAVAGADYAIFASPTYKASYTGLLKAFLDRYPGDGLAGVIAFPVLTIGSPAHALAVEFALRPLLAELGASVPTRGLAFEARHHESRDAVLDEWIAQQLPSIPTP